MDETMNLLVRNGVSQKAPPFERNIVETAAVARALTERLGIPVEPKKIGWALRKIGIRVVFYLEATETKSGRMVSVWVIRNTNNYRNGDGRVNEEAVRFEFESYGR